MQTYNEVSVGDRLPDWEFELDRADLVRYAGASGDFNPIHWDVEHARAAGLPDVIAHGMLTMGRCIIGVIEWLGDAGAVLEYGVRFVQPVPVPQDGGCTVRVTAEVVQKCSGRTVRLELSVEVAGQPVFGRAELIARLA